MSIKSKVSKEGDSISKLINNSDSDEDQVEHELSFYVGDRIKLMKEILKIIKPKKIKSMAPECIRHLDIEEINSLLLEELLGISNKRLKYIFNGQNLSEDSSSTDPEEEKHTIDIISLDDVSDDDLVVEVDPVTSKKKKKRDAPVKKMKKEKPDKKIKHKDKEEMLQEDNLMSVLELLELQARARAIRSQLILEANKRGEQDGENNPKFIQDEDSDADAIIIESPKNEEIVITSSDSENEKLPQVESTENKKKFTLIRDRVLQSNQRDIEAENKAVLDNTNSDAENGQNKRSFNKDVDQLSNKDESEKVNDAENLPDSHDNSNTNFKDPTMETSGGDDDGDEIILVVDQEEMDNIIGDKGL